MADISRIPASVSRHLKYYVYLYVHPETGEVFYVGKGKGNRAMAHAGGDGDTPHDEVIRDLKSRGLEPRVEVLIHGLDTDREALAVEMAAIDLLSLERLTNRVHGHHSSRRGRMSLEQVLTLYQREPVEIDDPVVLIKIATSFRYGMEPVELYDLTRSCWRASGTRRDTAQYALAVHEGVVREVYRITAWLPSGSTFRHDFPAGVPIDDRWEFVGTIAAEEIRQKYLSRSVGHYFTEGSQNPIPCVNC